MFRFRQRLRRLKVRFVSFPRRVVSRGRRLPVIPPEASWGGGTGGGSGSVEGPHVLEILEESVKAIQCFGTNDSFIQ